ncbi:hypothetical protein [Sphingomonas sp. LaA6.9]|nr:hypothetical protein [Sphingomonas sp. LaA6.9]
MMKKIYPRERRQPVGSPRQQQPARWSFWDWLMGGGDDGMGRG